MDGHCMMATGRACIASRGKNAVSVQCVACSICFVHYVSAATYAQGRLLCFHHLLLSVPLSVPMSRANVDSWQVH